MKRFRRTVQGIGIAVSIIIVIWPSAADAATVWNPAANGIIPPAAGNWAVAANWTNEVPGVNDGKAVFNVPGAAECVVTDPHTFHQLSQGDGGHGGVIRIANGGSLTTGPVWSAVGYNNSAHMIVETGGSVTFGDHMWVGFFPGDPGILDITGGTVRVNRMTGLGWAGGTGFVNVYEGLLELNQIHATDSINGLSLINIENGVMTLYGNQLGKVNDYIVAGKIVGFDGTGNVLADFGMTTPGMTTVTAIPEPTTLLLLGLGATMVWRRRYLHYTGTGGNG